uniref:Uncharacterized protein n=1 Tax=Lepeophtheirus salmonis TaxID=72036 RepID=A0A0K2TQQ1_LEPSM
MPDRTIPICMLDCPVFCTKTLSARTIKNLRPLFCVVDTRWWIIKVYCTQIL